MILSRTFNAVILFFLIILATGCFKFENPYSAIAPGKWRGVLKLNPEIIAAQEKLKPFEVPELDFKEVAAGELPFVFEINYTTDTSITVSIFNADETIKLDEVSYGKDITTGNDTISIYFPVFDSQISAIYEDNVMEGKWVVNNRKINNELPYEIPFVAFQGKDFRFTTIRKAPAIDLTGKWEATFEVETDHPYKGIGEFKQEGNQVTGTFLTDTGDYRYLEGTIQENKVYLSCFDGSHAFLFEAKVLEDSTLIGSFTSGIHYKTLWEAKKNEDFSLKDPYEITHLKQDSTFHFSFKNDKGQLISLNDPEYEGKAKLVQIMGTYCPNCRDESKFLTNYFKEHNHPDIAVIALAFERHKDESKAMEAISRYKQRMGVTYEVLLAGHSDKKMASSALSMLNEISSYPTLLFIDKENKVQKIHTGFSGPATSGYKNFVQEFEEIVQELTSD